ncbi:MAG TPA: helix-turn-helix transcriptional regulator [Dysgonomonas sp.]|uniref:helix-turn-helix domain-containing protein n=1 Tax=unclassified Dysgonomonas TaxID=2630389 RepID=UPI0025B9C0BB|nr:MULTISPECIES: helix-turn-helix transcriptional regulator [unclassified Dysgonomonas]HML64725.1 helix-turn-helix transcriptional regulator [Dysgonomonas sp.]
MEAVISENEIDQGKNIRLARTWKKVTQTDLADKLGIHQTEVSNLESKKTIDDKLLDQIALAMDIPVDFLKSFDPEEAINSYIVHDISMAQSDNVSGIMNAQQNVQKQEVFNYPIEKFTEYLDKLLILTEENAILKYKLKKYEEG